MIFEGTYRRFTALKGGKAALDARFTHQESLAIGQVEPASFEMTRAGRRFSIAYNGTAPTGIAPVQAMPTTAAQWAIWNGENVGGKSYIFTTLGAMLFSGTKGLGGQLLASIFALPVQTGLAQQTGVAIASHSGSAIGSKAVIKSGITITNPAVPLWFPVAEDILAVATVGPGDALLNRNIEGRVILPPQTGLGLVVLAPAGTTPLYLPVAEWVELESDLE